MKPSVSQYKQHDIEWAESSLTRFDLQGSLELLNKQNIICNVSLYVNETPSALKTNHVLVFQCRGHRAGYGHSLC